MHNVSRQFNFFENRSIIAVDLYTSSYTATTIIIITMIHPHVFYSKHRSTTSFGKRVGFSFSHDIEYLCVNTVCALKFRASQKKKNEISEKY